MACAHSVDKQTPSALVKGVSVYVYYKQLKTGQREGPWNEVRQSNVTSHSPLQVVTYDRPEGTSVVKV